ncbi:OPT oligopeptide transporter protein-domain-containing protein [Armillaria fumosa]|nr:OPT oligopeptide transporter protein-domain-containing protein [Armillaria fumosa]
MIDLKLGQYTKLPPRITFATQMAGSIIGSIFNYTSEHCFVFFHRDVLKDPTGTRVWSGWNIQSVNSASVAMGALGKELFTYGKESRYWIIPFGMFIGLFCPIPFWVIHRYSKPGSSLAKTMKYINVPIITLYIGYLPYSVNGQWWSCFVIGFFSQWWLRKHRPGWFKKYNYLTSAALDGGSQVILFILIIQRIYLWTGVCRRDGREYLTSIRGKVRTQRFEMYRISFRRIYDEHYT